MDTSLRNNHRMVVQAGGCAQAYAASKRKLVAKHSRKNGFLSLVAFLIAAVTFCLLFMPRTAVSAVPEKFVTYTVRPGDTLWNYAAAITSKNGDVSDNVEKLIALNHLSSADLEVGQSINVPVVDAQ